MNIYPHSSSNTNQASPLWLDLNHLLNPGFFVHLDMACLHLIIFSPYKKDLTLLMLQWDPFFRNYNLSSFSCLNVTYILDDFLLALGTSQITIKTLKL
jgi:hypothetical protein